jgi:hypothetical protein
MFVAVRNTHNACKFQAWANVLLYSYKNILDHALYGPFHMPAIYSLLVPSLDGKSETSVLPTDAPCRSPAHMAATRCKPAMCCAARPGLGLPARIEPICIGLRSSALRQDETRTTCSNNGWAHVSNVTHHNACIHSLPCNLLPAPTSDLTFCQFATCPHVLCFT